MDSLDAQASVIEVMEGEVRLPDVWRHDRSGALTFAFEEGGSTFTWTPEQVADMARQWRDSGNEVPEAARVFIDLHRRLDELLRGADLGPPDVTTHDFARREVQVVWKDHELVLIIDQVERPQPTDKTSDGSVAS